MHADHAPRYTIFPAAQSTLGTRTRNFPPVHIKSYPMKKKKKRKKKPHPAPCTPPINECRKKRLESLAAKVRHIPTTSDKGKSAETFRGDKVLRRLLSTPAPKASNTCIKPRIKRFNKGPPQRPFMPSSKSVSYIQYIYI